MFDRLFMDILDMSKTAAIVIACLAAIAIIVLIFIAIPKSKSKPGGTGNKN